MNEGLINLPINERIKDIIKKPVIFCVTPSKKGENILRGEDEYSNNGSDDEWNDNTGRNLNTGWDINKVNSGCSPCCSPCSPCLPNTNRDQCSPDDNSCYPSCNPCNPCYPCNPVEEFDRDRG